MGKAACAEKLTGLGWAVKALPPRDGNSDFLIEKGSRCWRIKVRTSLKQKGYITGGGVNSRVVEGGPIFNRSEKFEAADFIIFLSYRAGGGFRFFIAPADEAERWFRKNVNAYWLTPKLNSTEPKKPNGQCDIFVADGDFPHARIVPDQRDEVRPFEERWDLFDPVSSDATRKS
jgi:hypothetical protein